MATNEGRRPVPRAIIEVRNLRKEYPVEDDLTAISGYAELIENHMVDPEQETRFAQEIQLTT